MKKLNTLFIAFAVLAAFACKKKEDAPVVAPPASGTVELSGDLTTQTLDASKKYFIKGQVFVRSGQTLTIPAGTILMGDKATKGALIIDRGGRIDAQGTAASPIVFTSAQVVGARDEGDWSGVILLGKAPVNAASPTIEGITPAVTYGGTDAADNSGIMKYVRIEFAGIALTPNNETNGLTLGAVGAGTTLEYIQSSFGGDDSFEWFGGTVNAKHLVAYAGWDDDFDTDNGFSGNVQYALGVRDPFQADQSGSNGFESDNDASASTNTPFTKAIFANVTIIGAVGDTSKAISGNFKNGAHLRRNTKQSIYNSAIVGYPNLILVDNNTTGTTDIFYTGGVEAFLKNNEAITAKFNKTTASTTISGAGGASAANILTYWNANNTAAVYATTNASYYSALSNIGINSNLFVANNGSYPANPNFAVSAGTLTSGAATLPAGFETVNYRGAFAGTDWTDGWANFDPKNVVY